MGGVSGEMLLDPPLLAALPLPPKPIPKSVIPKRLEPLPPLASNKFLDDAPGMPGGDVSPLVIPLSGLPVPPLLPEEGPPITVPRLIPSPIELEF